MVFSRDTLPIAILFPFTVQRGSAYKPWPWQRVQVVRLVILGSDRWR